MFRGYFSRSKSRVVFSLFHTASVVIQRGYRAYRRNYLIGMVRKAGAKLIRREQNRIKVLLIQEQQRKQAYMKKHAEQTAASLIIQEKIKEKIRAQKKAAKEAALHAEELRHAKELAEKIEHARGRYNLDEELEKKGNEKWSESLIRAYKYKSYLKRHNYGRLNLFHRPKKVTLMDKLRNKVIASRRDEIDKEKKKGFDILHLCAPKNCCWYQRHDRPSHDRWFSRV